METTVTYSDKRTSDISRIMVIIELLATDVRDMGHYCEFSAAINGAQYNLRALRENPKDMLSLVKAAHNIGRMDGIAERLTFKRGTDKRALESLRTDTRGLTELVAALLA
jgi:hypothetical protein